MLIPWIDGSVVTVAVEDDLGTQRLGYVYDSLSVLCDGVAPAGDAVARGCYATALVVAKVRLPSGAGRLTLRITGVSPTDRPLTVEIALARPGDPLSWVSVGALAMGRKRSDATFPDTELCFDNTAAVHRLSDCPGGHGLRFGNFAARATGPSHGSRKHDSISCTADRASQPITLGWTANSVTRVLHLCRGLE